MNKKEAPAPTLDLDTLADSVVRRGVANIAQHQSRVDRDEIEARIERAFEEGVDRVLKTKSGK